MGDCAIFPSSARRGGRAIKKKFPFRYGAAGVVSSAKTWARRSDHPVCAASVASLLFITGAATPPRRGGVYRRTSSFVDQAKLVGAYIRKGGFLKWFCDAYSSYWQLVSRWARR